MEPRAFLLVFNPVYPDIGPRYRYPGEMYLLSLFRGYKRKSFRGQVVEAMKYPVYAWDAVWMLPGLVISSDDLADAVWYYHFFDQVLVELDDTVYDKLLDTNNVYAEIFWELARRLPERIVKEKILGPGIRLAQPWGPPFRPEDYLYLLITRARKYCVEHEVYDSMARLNLIVERANLIRAENQAIYDGIARIYRGLPQLFGDAWRDMLEGYEPANEVLEEEPAHGGLMITARQQLRCAEAVDKEYYELMPYTLHVAAMIVTRLPRHMWRQGVSLRIIDASLPETTREAIKALHRLAGKINLPQVLEKYADQRNYPDKETYMFVRRTLYSRPSMEIRYVRTRIKDKQYWAPYDDIVLDKILEAHIKALKPRSKKRKEALKKAEELDKQLYEFLEKHNEPGPHDESYKDYFFTPLHVELAEWVKDPDKYMEELLRKTGVLKEYRDKYVPGQHRYVMHNGWDGPIDDSVGEKDKYARGFGKYVFPVSIPRKWLYG